MTNLFKRFIPIHSIIAYFISLQKTLFYRINTYSKVLHISFSFLRTIGTVIRIGLELDQVLAEMTGGGLDRSIECTGNVKVMISAFECVHDVFFYTIAFTYTLAKLPKIHISASMSLIYDSSFSLFSALGCCCVSWSSN